MTNSHIVPPIATADKPTCAVCRTTEGHIFPVKAFLPSGERYKNGKMKYALLPCAYLCRACWTPERMLAITAEARASFDGTLLYGYDYAIEPVAIDGRIVYRATIDGEDLEYAPSYAEAFAQLRIAARVMRATEEWYDAENPAAISAYLADEAA